MRILLYTPAFLPMVGGLEINIANLAEQMTLSGHEIVVVTTTPDSSEEDENHPYRVVRCPSPAELLRWARWCEVFFQANVSLRGLWPLLLVHRPWVVSHHSWYCQPDGRIVWRDRLKRYLLRYAAASLAVSQAMAQDLGGSTGTIQNPYRDQLFRILPGIERTGDIIFLGRLVSDKGVDVLLSALSILSREGFEPRLTIVGDGPEAPRLEAHVEALDLTDRIKFLGKRQGPELVEILNRHRLMVVPSRYDEPFGIVALEGIACGCVIVGSEGGGLPEAIGPCGRTFKNGDAQDLARVLAELLRHPEGDDVYLRHAETHLVNHRSGNVAAAHLRVLTEVVSRAKSRMKMRLAA
jgi:glycogen synthase